MPARPAGPVGAAHPRPAPAGAAGAGRPLIIGYGNPLRGDDGIGWWLARALAGDPRAAGMDVIAAHQLTPELAEDLHLARRAVLVDALAPDGAAEPGRWAVSELPAGQPPPAPAGVFSHHHSPAALAALARQLYGAVPPVTLVGVAAGSTAPTGRLTPALERALVPLSELVLRLANRA